VFLADGKLEDKDIPHHTKIASMILDEHTKQITLLKAELLASKGWISFTIDLWTDPNLNPFMAVTVHWCSENAQGNAIYSSGLIAFHHTPWSHTGEALCEHFLKIIDDYGIANRVSLPNSILVNRG
jgi:hypothetical protein